MNNLDQKIKEFSEAIRETTTFQEYQRANELFQKDKEARKLLEEFQMAQQTLAIFQQGNFPGQEEQKGKAEQLLVQVRNNRIISEWIESQRRLQELVNRLAISLSQDLNFPFTLPQGGGGCCG